jgi:type I restriction-modification system DNA methylase subunit
LTGDFSLTLRRVFGVTNKTKERIKATGEVFTPQWLVDEMLDELPQDVFTNPEKTFIDPACGDGNFLVRVLERKIQNGSTPLQALQTTYGVDIMQDNIDDCRRRLIKVAMGLNSGKLEKSWREPLLNNIKCANTLEKPLEEIFSD